MESLLCEDASRSQGLLLLARMRVCSDEDFKFQKDKRSPYREELPDIFMKAALLQTHEVFGKCAALLFQDSYCQGRWFENTLSEQRSN